jgi:glycine cleavage system aminomethyltransferase T
LAQAPVFAQSGQIGVVTSACWSPTFETSLALAYLRPSAARPGEQVEVEVLGERRLATLRRSPLYDPDNARLKE